MSDTGKRLQDKVAIITGAGQGIGAAIAEAYAREGARVLITGRTLSKLEKVAGRITEKGGVAAPLRATAGDETDSRKTVDRVMADWGRIDVLVNNAHTFTDYLPLTAAKMEEHCKTDFQSGFFGSLQLMQLCYPYMVKQGGGSIINFGSSFGIRCEPGFLAYAASKEAIRALTRTAAKEWGKDRIRVNTLLPSALSPKAVSYLEESGTYDAELSKVAMGRFGGPEDIAPTAVFLASDEADYVTGQTIGVDGGSTMF